MVLWSYPPTSKQLAVTVCGCIAGVAMIGIGAHLSLVNIAPQQARTKARNDYVKARLREILGD